MSSWSGLDFLIFLMFFINVILGMSRGASKEIISMMCLSVALIFTIKFTMPLTRLLNSSPLVQDVLSAEMIQNFMNAIGAPALTQGMLQELSYCVSLLLCFTAVFSVCEATINYSGFVEVFSFPYATLNRKVGAGLGCTRGYVLTLILVIITQHLFQFNGGNNSPIAGSYFVGLFQGAANKLDGYIGSQQVDRYKDVFIDKNLYNEKDVLKGLSQ